MPDPLTCPVLTRRAVLVGLAAGITAGCTGSSSSPRASGSTTQTPRPSTSQTGDGGPSSGGPLPADAAVRRAAIAREQALAHHAAAVVAAHPALASVRMAAAFPTAHIEALAETLAPAAGSSPSASAHPPKSTKSLANALHVAAAAHRKAASTSSADLARLLSSIAASDSALAAALRS